MRVGGISVRFQTSPLKNIYFMEIHIQHFKYGEIRVFCSQIWSIELNILSFGPYSIFKVERVLLKGMIKYSRIRGSICVFLGRTNFHGPDPDPDDCPDFSSFSLKSSLGVSFNHHFSCCLRSFVFNDYGVIVLYTSSNR